MDWGILQGLGQGMQIIGGNMMDISAEKRRAAMAEKLEQDRFNREQSKFDPTQTKYKQIDTDGGPLWYEVKHNKAGDVIDRQLAPKNVIDEMTAAQEERTLKGRLTKAQVANAEHASVRNEIEAKREDEKYGYLTPEDRRTQARIDAGLEPNAGQKLTASTSLQNAVTRSSGAKDTPEMSQAEVAKAVLNDSPQLESKWVDSELMTKNQLLVAIMEADSRWRAEGKSGPPPMSYFDGYIEQMINGDPSKLGDMVFPSLAKTPPASGTKIKLPNAAK